MTHIRTIKVISNTHWDREFRHSFERTRKGLLTMFDTILDILDKDPDYHSYTLDGHSILLDDYLEMRPENRARVEAHMRSGRLVAGPWYTLPEQFSISHEAIVRNFLYGRKTVEKYGGTCGTVAYTPASWGQTGQLPQILKDFGLDKMMFYRGISHHESDAEFIWEGPDGTRVLGCRFGLFARYNWYYQVHRPTTRNGRIFEKDYLWDEFSETPVRFSDSCSGHDPSYVINQPAISHDPSVLKSAIEQMITAEGHHFTTPVFPAMHGHDISVAHPLETRIIEDARKSLGEKYTIAQSNLEEYWHEVSKHLDTARLALLKGERRSYLKTGMWTYLFPATISARTYLKQQEFDAYTRLVYQAEPLAALAWALGNDYPVRYFDKAWRSLLSNHTHDANGGCAPDAVCMDMEYRYRNCNDISELLSEEAMTFIAMHAGIGPESEKRFQVIVFNPFPFERDAIIKTDLEIPELHTDDANTTWEVPFRSVKFIGNNDHDVEYQSVSCEKSSVFADNIWDVPSILSTVKLVGYARFHKLPPLGYRCYTIETLAQETMHSHGMITGSNAMENEFIMVEVNQNGTVNITHKETGRSYTGLNYLSDQGEAGNAWQHEPPRHDRVFNSIDGSATISVTASGPLLSSIQAAFSFKVPVDYADGTRRSDSMAELPVTVDYILGKGTPYLKVRTSLVNHAKDHWLRANFPTGIDTSYSVADSHFDVVEREIAIPDSTGWVEEARGTHPLRSFAGLSNGKEGLAVFTKGLFEYEAFDDQQRTLAITLIRACRIKLKVSEEKTSELPDEGIQCPGAQVFEYAICPHAGDYMKANLVNLAASCFIPVRALMAGKGTGKLMEETFLFRIDNRQIHVSALKMAEDQSGIIIRMFNPTATVQLMNMTFPKPVKAFKVRMDEQEESLIGDHVETIPYKLHQKQILTMKIIP